MLRVIERATRQPIEPMQLPSIADVNEQRVARFNARIAEALSAEDIGMFRDLVGRYEQEHNVPALDIAAGGAHRILEAAHGIARVLMNCAGIGGSQRIHDHDLLLERIKQHNLPVEAFQWYLDVRQYGAFPHSGFGMGIERFVAWMCGLSHLRETIPYPRLLYKIYP